MKIYILMQSKGEYSDYEAFVVGVYRTKREAKARIAAVADAKAEDDAYDKIMWDVLHARGYDKCKDWKARRKIWDKYQEENPRPAKKAIIPLWPKDAEVWTVWDAGWDILEVEV